MEKKTLNISSWNIHGYSHKGYNKYNDPQFIDLICKNDIICLMETHCDVTVALEIADFSSVHLVRPLSKNKKRFGGLSVYVKKNIRPGVKFLKHQTNDYIWLQLSQQFFGTQTDIFLCYMYDPHAESPYTKSLNIDYFDILEKEVAHFSQLGNVIIGGGLECSSWHITRFYS